MLTLSTECRRDVDGWRIRARLCNLVAGRKGERLSDKDKPIHSGWIHFCSCPSFSFSQGPRVKCTEMQRVWSTYLARLSYASSGHSQPGGVQASSASGRRSVSERGSNPSFVRTYVFIFSTFTLFTCQDGWHIVRDALLTD